MKILQVVHGFPPKQRAGTELYTYYLSKELAKKHEVHVLYPSFEDIKRVTLSPFKRENINHHELRLPNNRVKTFWSLLFLENTYINEKIEKVFRSLVKELNPDIIHFEHLIGLSANLIDIAKELDVPSVFTLHDYWFICPNIQLLKYDYTICEGPEPSKCQNCWIERKSCLIANRFKKYYLPKSLSKTISELVLRVFNPVEKFEKRTRYLISLLQKVDKIIAPSKFLRDIFIKHGIQKDKIIYSENGYNLDVFNGFKKKRRKSNKIIFGFVGSIIPAKGVHVLIDAFVKVPEDKAELRIYGNYDPKSEYVRKILTKIKGKRNIKFVGKFEDVREPYYEIDVLVFSSIWYENCPLVLAEARATRTPVIASNLGAIPEFVEDGRTGLLFEPNNPKDLYEKIMQIIENPELIEKFKTNIRPPKNIREQAKELEKIYRSLIRSEL